MTVKSVKREEDGFGLFKFGLFSVVKIHFNVVIVHPGIVALILSFENFRLALHWRKLKKFFAILTALLIGDFFILFSV